MMQVSIKTLRSLLFAGGGSLLVAACSSVPVSQEAAPAESEQAAKKTAEKQAEPIRYSATNGILPKQPYDALGNKMPYLARPNPYLSASDAAVPGKARSLYRKAREASQDEDWELAQALLERLTGEYPDLSGPWLMKGKVLEKQDRPEDALAAYAQAISANPDNVYAYVHRGLLLRQQGRFDAAKQSYLDVLAVWPDFAEAHRNLAILYDLYMNQPDQAQKHYEAYLFLAREPDSRAEIWLAEVRQRTGIETSFIDQAPVLPFLLAQPDIEKGEAEPSDTEKAESESGGAELAQQKKGQQQAALVVE